jgi:hypothetical protein
MAIAKLSLKATTGGVARHAALHGADHTNAKVFGQILSHARWKYSAYAGRFLRGFPARGRKSLSRADHAKAE